MTTRHEFIPCSHSIDADTVQTISEINKRRNNKMFFTFNYLGVPPSIFLLANKHDSKIDFNYSTNVFFFLLEKYFFLKSAYIFCFEHSINQA